MRQLSLILPALLLLISGLAPASAQSLLPPPVGERAPLDLPETRTITLDNGLTITFVPWGMTPTVDVVVSVRAGNIDEGRETWLSDLTVDMMAEGFAGRDKEEISDLFADMGGSLSAAVIATHSTFGTFVLSEHGPRAVELLAEAVRQPDFPPAALRRVRANMIRDVELVAAMPDSIADSALMQHLFDVDHPYYRYLPTAQQLRGHSLEDLRRFHRAHFGAARTHIYIAGRFDERAMENAVRRYFGDWDAGPEDNAINTIPSPGPVVHLINRPGAPQSTVRLVYPVSSIDAKSAPAVSIMDATLGGTIAAVIRDLGYSYSPGSFLRWTRGGGYWNYFDAIDTPHTGEALMQSLAIIDWLRAESWDISGTQNWLASTYVMETGSTSGLIGQLMHRDGYGLPQDHLETYVDELMDVTPQQVSAAVRAYLRHDRMVLVIVGDMARIEDSIRAIPQLQGARFVRTEAGAPD